MHDFGNVLSNEKLVQGKSKGKNEESLVKQGNPIQSINDVMVSYSNALGVNPSFSQIPSLNSEPSKTVLQEGD